MNNGLIEMRPDIGLDGQPVYCAIKPAAAQDGDLEPETFVLDAPAPLRPRLAVLLLAGGAFLLAVSRKK